jgi:hypothetical protein
MIATTARPTAKRISESSKNDWNEAGKAVLRSCCVEPFVADGKTLELLTLACNAAQHRSREERNEDHAKLLIDHEKRWRSRQDSNLQPAE